MDRTTKGQRFTEQGGDPSSGREQWCWDWPYPSRDSPGPLAVYQAEEPRSATGRSGVEFGAVGGGYSNTDSESKEEEVEEDFRKSWMATGVEEGGFVRSKKIQRTPVKGQKNTPKLMDEEIARQEKRKRTEESPKQEMKKKEKGRGMFFSKPRTNIVRVTEELEKLVSGHTNTKVEIKKLVKDLAYNVRNMVREGESSDDREEEELSDGNQRMLLQRRMEVLEREWSELRQRNRKLEEARSPEKLARFLKANWRREWYVNTVFTQGTPLAEGSGDVAVIATPQEKDMARGIMKAVRERYPALLRLTANNRIQWVKSISMTQIEEERYEQESRRIVYKGPVGTVEDTEILAILDKLKEAVIINGSETIACPVIKGIATEKMRKLVEMAIFVRQEDKPYIELLKKIKDTMADKKMADKIRGVRRVKDGRLLLMINKGEEHVNDVKDAIEAKVGAVVTVGDQKRSWTRIKVVGMDALITVAEIEQAIKYLLKKEGEVKMEMGIMRPTQGDNQVVTIRIEKSLAEEIVRVGRIRIGLNMCRVEE